MIDGKKEVKKIPSKFSGPVRLSDNVNDVESFEYEFMEEKYSMSLEHYGIVRMKPKKGVKK